LKVTIKTQIAAWVHAEVRRLTDSRPLQPDLHDLISLHINSNPSKYSLKVVFRQGERSVSQLE
jgi:hypothetical protein